MTIPSNKTDSRGFRRTELKPSSHPAGSKRMSLGLPPGGRDTGHRCNSLRTVRWKKGVPRDPMQELPTDKLEQLVLGWPESHRGDLLMSCFVGPGLMPITFLVDTGVHISAIKTEDVVQSGITLSKRRVFIADASGIVQAQTSATVSLQCPGGYNHPGDHGCGIIAT